MRAFSSGRLGNPLLVGASDYFGGAPFSLGSRLFRGVAPSVHWERVASGFFEDRVSVLAKTRPDFGDSGTNLRL